MFYSHTFLARKGPLGLVWIASHLIRKLSKKQCLSTDVPSTVDRIMFPEVPIALRLSGYLLLGIVRIYAKQVDYVHTDCQLFQKEWRAAFIAADINLPESASHAQFEAVTLPETFELDAMDLDKFGALDGTQDDHQKNPEEITLIDEVPIDTDRYVAINFDDDIMQDVLQVEIEPDVQARDDPMEAQNTAVEEIEPDSSLRLRHADPNDSLIELPSVLDQSKSPAEPTSDRMNDEMPVQTPPSLESEPLLRRHSEIPSSARDTSPNTSGPRISFGIDTLELRPSPRDEPGRATEVAQQSSPSELALRPSPTAEAGKGTELAQQSSPADKAVCLAQLQNQSLPHAVVTQARGRKRKLFDRVTVLTNRYINQQMEDCSDIVRKQRKLPDSPLNVWRYNNVRRGEQMFFEPLISGMCAELQSITKRGFISSKSQLLLSHEHEEERTTVEPPASNANTDMEIDQTQQRAGPDTVDDQARRSRSPSLHDEIERLRDPEPHLDQNLLDDILPPVGSHLQHGQGDQTPSGAAGRTSPVSVPSLMLTPDLGTSTDPFGSRPEIPAPDFDTGDHAGRPDTSPLIAGVVDELAFLEEDSASPSNSQGLREDDGMSARTRAVAQFLRRRSSASHDENLPSGDLSLNRMLEGRSRKVCARMFFETLNLKTHNLIDVNQNEDEPYSDIILKLPSSLSKMQLSCSSPS